MASKTAKNGASAPRWSLKTYLTCAGFNNDIFNALTACLPLALFWRRHLNNDDPVLAASCFVFCIVAAAGHVWPRALQGSTHLVKLAFTPVALQGADASLTLGVAACTVVPFFFPSLSKVEPLSGGARQLWMAYRIITLFREDSIRWQTIVVMGACKLLYRQERQARMKRGKRDEYAFSHAAEHLDLFLYVAVTSVTFDNRLLEYARAAGLTLVAVCASIDPFVEHGDGGRALLGAIALMMADYSFFRFVGTVRVGIVAVLATVAYVFENRGGGASTRPLLRMATALVVGHAVYVAGGVKALCAFGLVESILVLLSGRDLYLTGRRVVVDDSAFIAHSLIVVSTLVSKPWHLFLAAAWSFSDAMDLRFSGRRGGGALHLSIVALYVYRDADVKIVYVLWFMTACAFCAYNVLLGLLTIQRGPGGDLPEECHAAFWTKLRGNAFAVNPIGYLLKPSSPVLSWERMSWARIEQDINEADFEGFEAELVVGVLSGGGFIRHIVAKRFPQADKGLIRSQVWSRISAKENMKSVAQVFSDKDEWRDSKCKELKWFVRPAKKSYARILVVDDSVSSGKTMQNVLRFVRAEFSEAEVRAFVLYAPPASSGGAAKSVDYVCHRGHVPLLWPWGCEMD